MNEFYQLLWDNLNNGDVVYVTGNGTAYTFNGWSNDGSLKYNINNSVKYIPSATIIGCKDASNLGIFNTNWFANHFPMEYDTRPCNYGVIDFLIQNYPIE